MKDDIKDWNWEWMEEKYVWINELDHIRKHVWMNELSFYEWLWWTTYNWMKCNMLEWMIWIM